MLPDIKQVILAKMNIQLWAAYLILHWQPIWGDVVLLIPAANKVFFWIRQHTVPTNVMHSKVKQHIANLKTRPVCLWTSYPNIGVWVACIMKQYFHFEVFSSFSSGLMLPNRTQRQFIPCRLVLVIVLAEYSMQW